MLNKPKPAAYIGGAIKGLSFFRELVSFFKSLDRRFKVMLVAIGLYNWSNNLSLQYNQLYAVSLGADPVELGSLNSLGGLVNSVISAPMGFFIDRHGVKKVIILGLLLSAIVSCIYGFAAAWWILIPAVILSQISLRMIIPLTDIIIVGTTKLNERVTAMGFSRTIWAIPTIFAPMIAGVIVSSFGGINVQGIRPLYFIRFATIVLIIIFVSIMLTSQVADSVDETSRLAHYKFDSKRTGIISGFKELFSEKWLKYWAAIMGLRQFGMSIAMPFIPLWMVKVKGADPYILGFLGTLSIVTSALLQVPMGRLADKIGRKKVFLMLRPFSYLGSVLLILAPRPEALIPIGILGTAGAMQGISSVSFIPFITMYWESVPAEKRGRLFGLTGLFGILSFLASILGGFLWESGHMIMVLLFPLLIDIMILILILMRIPEMVSGE